MGAFYQGHGFLGVRKVPDELQLLVSLRHSFLISPDIDT